MSSEKVPEINLCEIAGCVPDPSCCHDVEISNLTNEELEENFPDAAWSEPEKPKEELGPGVYVSLQGILREDIYKATIVGPCPNQGPGGICKNYKKRPRPCRDTKRGGPVCAKHRIKDERESVEQTLHEDSIPKSSSLSPQEEK